jgi:4,5-dihydroxyphthalate decarboxylase
MSLRLTAGFSNNLRVRPLMDGTVKPQNIDLEFVISPAAELFYRNLKYEEFDIMEMSIAYCLMAMERSRGENWRWKALPVFLSKSFLFVYLYTNSAAAIDSLSDLKDKRVGVPDYPMDGVLWLCILLKELNQIGPSEIVWYNARAKQFSHGALLGLDKEPPPGIRFNWIENSQTLDVMLDRGELDAALIQPAVLKQSRGPNIDRYGGTPLANNPRIRKLFTDGGAEVIERYFRRTGIIPPNHIVVVKEKVLRENPWVALELFKAFQRSNEVAYERARELSSTLLLFEGNDLERQAAIFGPDPYLLGVAANRRMLETAVDGCLAQGLIKKKFRVEEIFHANTLDT